MNAHEDEFPAVPSDSAWQPDAATPLEIARMLLKNIREEDRRMALENCFALISGLSATAPINLCENPAAVAMRYIEDLRRPYGASILILCDDEEADSREEQMAIEVSSDWTDHTPARFYGESVLQCLAKAIAARGIAADLTEKTAPIVPRPDVHEIGERLEALYPRIVLDIASAESDALEQLAALGIYGASADDVATYLIIRGLDDLARAGILPLNFERKPDLAEAAE